MSFTYVCDGCGVCCRTKLVEVYEVDLLREPKLQDALVPVREADEIGYINCLKHGGCPFLDASNRCGIYPTRPCSCVLFEPGGEDCQEVRLMAGLPPLVPVTPG